MSERTLLHKNSLDEFLRWAPSNGFTLLPRTLNIYEVFRMKDRKDRLHVGYVRSHTDHVTISGMVMHNAVRQFIKERRESQGH